jgi:hypothetical protein
MGWPRRPGRWWPNGIERGVRVFSNAHSLASRIISPELGGGAAVSSAAEFLQGDVRELAERYRSQQACADSGLGRPRVLLLSTVVEGVSHHLDMIWRDRSEPVQPPVTAVRSTTPAALARPSPTLAAQVHPGAAVRGFVARFLGSLVGRAAYEWLKDLC